MARERRRTSKREYMKRYVALETEYNQWKEHHRECADYTIPRRTRFTLSDNNRGQKVHGKIINSTPCEGVEIHTSGLMSGVSSPARPWFRLGVPQPHLMKVDKVRLWLHQTAEVIFSVLARSNAYNGLALTYRDLSVFGTAALIVEQDPISLIRCYSQPVGSYFLATSARQQVDTIYLKRRLSVLNIAERFGLANASDVVRNLWEQNNIDEKVEVVQAIEPNEVVDSADFGKGGKQYRSVWFEHDAEFRDGAPLFVGGGYSEFPAMCPRWDVNGDDVYGESATMRALGDIKGLMTLEKRKLSNLGKLGNPPMVGPSSLERKRKSQLAGDMTYVDTTPGSQKFEPAFQLDPRSVYLGEEIDRHERRIMRAYKADLFLMLAQMSKGQPITAREVDERHEEKMLQLGPMLDRLHDELLAPLIRRVFEILVRISEPMWKMGFPGIIPVPPSELMGQELRVEFISILAQAQKLLSTNAVERFLGLVRGSVDIFPEAADKVDIDETIDDYGQMLGVNPDIIVTGDELAQKRAQREKRLQMQAMASAAKPTLDAAKALETLQGSDARSQLGQQL